MNAPWEDDVNKLLIPKYSITLHIYGLSKVHKEDIPLKAIVNTFGSPTYKLAKLLASKPKILVQKTNSFVKDSIGQIREIKYIKVEEDDIVFSFDVVSLFTKIPIQEAINVIKNITNDKTVKLVSVCFNCTFFNLRGTIYEQIEGISMGSPLSPVIDNLYMENFKKCALVSSPLTVEVVRR
jgi:hypothetical protein